jgi:CRP-like cAMP-binding protein
MSIPTTETPDRVIGNALLTCLPERERELLRPHVTTITLKHAEPLYTTESASDVAYFPLTCIVSMIAEMENGDECEYGCIGREGMLGLHVALEAQPLRGRALCQLAGDTIRLDGALLRSLTVSGKAPTLHRVLLRYAQATINVLAQSAACNALHSVPQRTARWLLLSRDRAGRETFALTQEFLAKMLGVRRASVTDAAAHFQRVGIIEYTRGHITVLNAAVLESASCECYQIMREEYDAVYGAQVVRPKLA